MDRSVSKYLSSSIKIDILSTTIKISIQQIGGTGQIKYNELDALIIDKDYLQVNILWGVILKKLAPYSVI